jgi:SAM-dependent methyltransferase
MGLMRTSDTASPLAASPAVVWHDLECGRYRADLPLWRELAEEARGDASSAAILDIGAGTGRVTLDLARAGHRVTALDIDGGLLTVLSERVRSEAIETVQADARNFQLSRHDYDLCLVPMQTIQLLGDASERVELFRRARELLRSGALLAAAIVTELEPFDSEREGRGPSPETVRHGERLYASRALSVRPDRTSVRIERERTISVDDATALTRERNLVVLARVSTSQLRSEGAKAGLGYAGTRTIAATDEHVGSTVVTLRA